MASMKPSGKIHVDGVHFYEELDERVVRLVAALNSLPSVYTISSCGGHRKPDKVQVGAGEFRVRFSLTKPTAGPTLRLIDDAISTIDWRRLTITEQGCWPRVTYELNGSDGVDPDELAYTLEFLRAENGTEDEDTPGMNDVERPNDRCRAGREVSGNGFS